MTTLNKNHPFIIEARRLEMLQANEGLTDEIIASRIKLKEKYPEYFTEYMKAKRLKQQEKAYKEKMEKEIQMRERRGFETISYAKQKIEEQKRINRMKKLKK